MRTTTRSYCLQGKKRKKKTKMRGMPKTMPMIQTHSCLYCSRSKRTY